MRQTINKDEYCYHCKVSLAVAPHEPLMGSKYRKLSIKYGLVIGLCDSCHKLLHADDNINTVYKKEMQELFESKYSHEEWMKVFGRNYL